MLEDSSLKDITYPSYEEWCEDGNYLDEKGNICYSAFDKKYDNIFDFNGQKNELKSIGRTDEDGNRKGYLRFNIDVKYDFLSFQRSYYVSEEFESSKEGYKEACRWFEEYKLKEG